MPVPVSETDCGLPTALSAMVIAPERFPVVAGSKVAVTVQLDPAARLAPQLLEARKLPVAVMLEIVIPLVLVFVSVILSAALLVPTVWLPKVKDVDESETVGSFEPPGEVAGPLTNPAHALRAAQAPTRAIAFSLLEPA